MTIDDLVREVHAIAKEKGWYDNGFSMGNFIANVHGETSEAWEAFRDPTHGPTEVWFREDGKPEGVPAELADIVIRIADTCAHLGIDLQAAIVAKTSYNRGRSYRHGGKRA